MHPKWKEENSYYYQFRENISITDLEILNFKQGLNAPGICEIEKKKNYRNTW